MEVITVVAVYSNKTILPVESFYSHNKHMAEKVFSDYAKEFGCVEGEDLEAALDDGYYESSKGTVIISWGFME